MGVGMSPFAWQNIFNNKCRRQEGDRKSALERYNNNRLRQDPQMNAEIKDKQNTCIASNCFSPAYVLITAVILTYVLNSLILLSPEAKLNFLPLRVS